MDIEDTDTFTALNLYYVIKSMGWENKIGHYIYYKLNLKKPKKTTLLIHTADKFNEYIETLNEDLKHKNPNKYNSLHDKLQNKCEGEDEDEDEDSSSDNNKGAEIIREQTINDFNHDFKFNRKCPYNDIIKIDKLSDYELANIISLRSQLTTDVCESCIY